MGSFDKFISSLERDFGPQVKGKKFEVFSKWFLQNDPQWSRLVDEVWYFEDYPDKCQTTDLGTDLVFKDKQASDLYLKFLSEIDWTSGDHEIVVQKEISSLKELSAFQ